MKHSSEENRAGRSGEAEREREREGGREGGRERKREKHSVTVTAIPVCILKY